MPLDVFASPWIWAGFVLAILIVAALLVRRKPRTALPEQPAPAPVEAPPNRLGAALSRTRSSWWTAFSPLAGRKSKELADPEWTELEEALLMADVSLATSQKLLSGVKNAQKEGASDLAGSLKKQIETLLATVENGWELPAAPKPLVISIVGVNGVGKTTTVGKLAYRFSQQGKTVLLGACDSFRAAAIEQLRVWSERAGSQFVAGREGADPGATAFDAVSAGVSRQMDVVLLDTAGRLHTKVHLMDELKRVHKVVKKVLPDAPHQVWLVVDGTLGQNSLVQAKQFHEALGLTGVIVTKLDGTAKGGSVLSIAGDLQLPVRFIGVGETANDLVPFEGQAFAQALFT